MAVALLRQLGDGVLVDANLEGLILRYFLTKFEYVSLTLEPPLSTSTSTNDEPEVCMMTRMAKKI